jgi:hypothetical protein
LKATVASVRSPLGRIVYQGDHVRPANRFQWLAAPSFNCGVKLARDVIDCSGPELGHVKRFVVGDRSGKRSVYSNAAAWAGRRIDAAREPL